jgi:rfaE bifunctional protein kinase chain/domain
MTAREYTAALPAKSALVVGDVCLDRWCRYAPSASEPSRETGIPRTAVVATETTPGAGGTIANNLAALGVGRISILGIAGDDGHGCELFAALERRGISAELMLREPEWTTFTYTKLINEETGVEDLPRIDFIPSRPLPEAVEARFIARLEEAAPAFDVVFISDQAETGQSQVVTARLRDTIAKLAGRHPDKVFWADSRLRAHEFRRVALKPNAEEAARALRLISGATYSDLLKHTQARCLVVTLGERGAMVVDAAGERLVESRHPGKPVDVCGAGDSFSAAAAMALALTGSAVEAARFGNLAAAITVMKPGTGTASGEELIALEASER